MIAGRESYSVILCPFERLWSVLSFLYPSSSASELNDSVFSFSPCVGNRCFGFNKVIISRMSSLELCPDTCMSLNILAPSFLSFSSMIALCCLLISAGIIWLLNITWSFENFH